MSDHWTPEAAQGRLDGRVKRMQDETRAFLAAKPAPLSAVWDHLRPLERDDAIISRAVAEMMSFKEVQLRTDRTVALVEKVEDPPSKTERLATAIGAQLVGGQKTAQAIYLAQSLGPAVDALLAEERGRVCDEIEAALDGYNFAGNSLAKAVCDDYAETIRVRLRVARRGVE